MAWDAELSGHWRSIRAETSLPELRVAAMAFTFRLTTETAGRWLTPVSHLLTLLHWRLTRPMAISLPELILRWGRAAVCSDQLTTAILGPNKIMVLQRST